MKAHWEYRLRKITYSDTLTHYEVVEVYFDEAGKVEGWCRADPPQGTSIEEAAEDYTYMGEAWNKEPMELEE